eukprot:1842329-Alexandrium_andersonii.AAC.1
MSPGTSSKTVWPLILAGSAPMSRYRAPTGAPGALVPDVGAATPGGSAAVPYEAGARGPQG